MDKQHWKLLKTILEGALELKESEIDDYLLKASNGDTQLLAELKSMLFNQSGITEEIENYQISPMPLLPNLEGEIFGRYRLLRKLGAGGMGVVYLAERIDGEYDQKVALKILQNRFQHESFIQKFKNEKQILANLIHPNIVRILDGGTSEHDWPYIVMEYVEGINITDYISEQALSLKEKLNLFVGLCNVISFAHQNLIIHRDIKPANILVDKAGDLKLLDFGIAKLINSDSQNTQETQQIMLTPDYASPEHITGSPLRASSEVYSLGVMLYEIITGNNPFDYKGKNISEIIKTVSKSEPLPPSKLLEKKMGVRYEVQKLKGDIDNICLQSLRKDPKERYQSVDLFSQDIVRYLNNRPVAATKGKWQYRSRKFFVRNWTSITTAAALLSIILIGLFSSLHQAKKAQKMFADLRSLTESMLFEFHDAIQNLPGATDARILVVSKALTYLDKMSIGNEDDDELMFEVASGYERIGQIQGNTYYANLGLTDEATNSYLKATKISEALVKKNPTNSKYLFGLSQDYQGLADMTYTVNKLDTSLYLYQNSLSILDRLSLEYPDSLNYKQALSTSHTRIGDVSGMFGYANLGNTPKAISSYNEAIKILEYLLEKHPENDESRNNLALSLSMISNLYYVSGQFNQAINYGYKALSMYEGLVELNPNNFARISGMLNLINLMRQPLIENLRYDEALSLLKNTESALEVMLKKDPANKMNQRNIGVNYNSIGRVLTAKGEYAQALIEHEKALRISMDLFKKSESNYESIRDLALTNEFIGNAHFDNKKYDYALDSYRKSMNIYPEPDEETKLLLDIKINLCLMELQTINNDLIEDQNLNLEKFEQLCIRDSMNLKNYSLLADFFRKTGLSIKSNSNKAPCDHFNKYEAIYKNMELKNALSPYSVLKHKPIIEALQKC